MGRHGRGLAVIGGFGDVDGLAAVAIKRTSARLGYENDSDFLYYMFSAGYSLEPHRFQLDVVYFQDRFTGAQMQTVGTNFDANKPGWTRQRTDSVLLMGSWTGQVGPVRGLVQGNLLLGTQRGGTLGIPTAGGVPLFAAGRHYDIFAGGVVAYGEVDLGIARPFVGLVWGSADGDPTYNKLHGFATYPIGSSAQVTGIPWFAHFDSSSAFGSRGYPCPARAQGLTNRATTSLNVGTGVLGTTGRGVECIHDVQQVFNTRMGVVSHLGIATAYSNVGTLVLPVGVKVFPLRGHELTGWYVYRAMVDSTLVEVAFAPELAAQGRRHIGKGVYHEVGGYWLWTLNPNFDIRLTGTIALAGDGYRDLARLADCNPRVAGVQPCHGDDLGLKAEARFRARF